MKKQGDSKDYTIHLLGRGIKMFENNDFTQPKEAAIGEIRSTHMVKK